MALARRHYSCNAQAHSVNHFSCTGVTFTFKTFRISPTTVREELFFEGEEIEEPFSFNVKWLEHDTLIFPKVNTKSSPRDLNTNGEW